VPNPVLVSPVFRIHLLDGEMGTYLNPSVGGLYKLNPVYP
jgi:hypothetical protein